jgi:TRAP-type mannitol/chloroaromatic compound transport system permease large subunit
VIQLFKGVIPFLIADLFIVALVIAAPSIVLFLPNLM